jgi:hypothetical protein
MEGSEPFFSMSRVTPDAFLDFLSEMLLLLSQRPNQLVMSARSFLESFSDAAASLRQSADMEGSRNAPQLVWQVCQPEYVRLL